MFRFKQFSIRQDKAIMKVGTDGVLTGVWTPIPDHTKSMLDVGAGTGLIALILAQRCCEAQIDAVELDDPSCDDMEANFEASPWANRLSVYRSSFQTFCDTVGKQYDLIVCNPPFFSGGMKNPSARKALARHNHALSHVDLIEGIKKSLRQTGVFSLILPVLDYENFRLEAARRGLYEYRLLKIRPTPSKSVKRVISVWGLQLPRVALQAEELVIELSRHHYSEEFRTLTRDFYLNI
ncbi:tRNA1(Val) (adenine(37)-N6)-methyltransferase [Thermophagus sp. OGC60D27]|uniref:tRNA1(Val) (adenine(37)-N6)-methyltransferase n=1 Tax=Thermophagus sp. OGC60D27 TaxID=3458415 RepID=UPI004037D7BD